MPRHKRGWAIKDDNRRNRRRTPLMVSLVEPALLLLVNQQACHGYAVHEVLKTLEIAPIHPSVVYRTLNQMVELEWMSFEWDTEAGQGPPRKLFFLTDLGKQALETWQDELNRGMRSIEKLLAL